MPSSLALTRDDDAVTAFLKRVDDAISRVQSLPDATRRAIFVEFCPDRIRADAQKLAARHRAGDDMPLFGILIAIKDMFDETGQITGAGSVLLHRERAPAGDDCAIIKRLRDAGALPFGRNTQSELAYSCLGVNDTYGTASSALMEGVIPGGSSSGSGVTVGLGLTDAALVTDTGGSARIPATINGVWGYKFSQGLMDTDGIQPLAASYDSPGVIARNGAILQRIAAVLMDRPPSDAPARLNIAVPDGAMTDNLTPDIQAMFNAELDRLRAAGHILTTVDCHAMSAAIWITAAIVSQEMNQSFADYRDPLLEQGQDPVRDILQFSSFLPPVQLQVAQIHRQQFTVEFDTMMQGYDAMLIPALMALPPMIEQARADFVNLSSPIIRNASFANMLDACAVVLPTPGAVPAWSMTMLMGRKNTDAALIAAARQIAG